MGQVSNSWTRKTSDGVIDTTVSHQAHENKMYVRHEHNKASRKIILDRNARIRKEQPFRKLEWGKPQACIPIGDLHAAQKQDPELLSTDPKTKVAAYRRLLLLHPEYLLHEERI